jgi:hypothetical protein
MGDIVISSKTSEVAAQHFFMFAIAIPQLEGPNSKEILLHNCISALPQSIAEVSTKMKLQNCDCTLQNLT